MKANTTASSAEKIAYCGIFTALALILSYLESLIPVSALLHIPGLKLGLANICITYVFFRYGKIDAFLVSLLRIIISSVLFGTPVSFLYSLFGGLFAFCFLMATELFFKNKLSMLGISVGCAFFHNIGQLCIFALIFSDLTLFSYLIYLIPCSLVTGCITGIILLYLQNRTEKHNG